jgi:hypothetical protein
MIDRDADVVLGQTIAAYAKKSHDARLDSPIEFAIAATVAGGIVLDQPNTTCAAGVLVTMAPNRDYT